MRVFSRRIVKGVEVLLVEENGEIKVTADGTLMRQVFDPYKKAQAFESTCEYLNVLLDLPEYVSGAKKIGD